MILSRRDLLQLLMHNLRVTSRKLMGLACFTAMGCLSQRAMFRPFCSPSMLFAQMPMRREAPDHDIRKICVGSINPCKILKNAQNSKLEDEIDSMKVHRSHMHLMQLLAAVGLVLTLVLVYLLAFAPQRQTLAGTPARVPGDDWPTYLHDIQRSAASGEVVLSPSNAEHLTKLWSFKTGGGIAASAAIVNNTVYIGSWDGYEYALDALTGFLKWKTYLCITTARCVPAKIGITSSATVQNNIVYVGGGDSYWYALDAYTGAILWKVYTGDNSADKGYYNWSSPLIYNGFAYIGIASNCDNPLVPGKLLKVSLNSHRVVNSFSVVNEKEVGGGIWTSPTLD